MNNFCTPLEASKYRLLIKSAGRTVFYKRFDIAYVTSTLTRYSTLPRKGHYKAVQRTYSYCRIFPHGKIFTDVNQPPDRGMVKIDIKQNWIVLYPQLIEIIPSDILETLSKDCTVTCYVDANHARDKLTCRFVTGVTLLVSNILQIWYTKRYNTVERFTYGSELVAARMGTELINEFRQKLRILGMVLERTS